MLERQHAAEPASTEQPLSKRVLRVDENGIFVGGRPFKVRKLDAPWADVKSVEVGERWGVIATRSGRVRKLDLPDIEGEAHVRHALREAQRRILPSEA